MVRSRRMPYRKNKRTVLNRFRSALKIALQNHRFDTRSPTAFSDAFNLRANGTTVITRQTASKWLNGETVPDHGHMAVLVSWLNLDLNAIYNLNEQAGNEESVPED